MSTVCPRCELIRPQWHGDVLRCGCCGLVYNDQGTASRSGVYIVNDVVNGRDAQGGRRGNYSGSSLTQTFKSHHKSKGELHK